MSCCDLRIRPPLPPQPELPPAPAPDGAAPPGFTAGGPATTLHRANDDDGPDVPPLHPALAELTDADDDNL